MWITVNELLLVGCHHGQGLYILLAKARATPHLILVLYQNRWIT